MGIVQLHLGTSGSAHRKEATRLTRAADFIRQNCTRSLKLQEICAETSLSASHLIRAFKEAHGLTPHAYQLNCRIEFCRSQLRAGHSIADVALPISGLISRRGAFGSLRIFFNTRRVHSYYAATRIFFTGAVKAAEDG